MLQPVPKIARDFVSRAAIFPAHMKLTTTIATLFSLAGLALFARAASLDVGAPAPEISAADQDGKNVDFKDVYAKGPTLVYFYPKADTPGCTKQACSIRDDWSALTGKGIQVLSVFSRDVLKRIAEKDDTWEQMVPEKVAEMIKKRGFFGYSRVRE